MKNFVRFVPALALAVVAFGIGTPLASAQSSDEEVQINVMKHICAEGVDFVEEFDSVEGPDDGEETNFHDKVLECPTVVLPEDDYADHDDEEIVNFGGKRDFDFVVSDDDGDTQDISEASFVNQKVTEQAVDVDVNGDGDRNDALGTSHYAYSGVADGDVTVTETESPDGTQAGALEFTPQALQENNDAETLEEDMNEVFADDDQAIELDTSADNDGVVTLHVYNFENDEVTDAELLRLLDEARVALLGLLDQLPSQDSPNLPNTGDGTTQ